VITAGRPSGIAATARATAIWKNIKKFEICIYSNKNLIIKIENRVSEVRQKTTISIF
jgi:hypothetical protein